MRLIHAASLKFKTFSDDELPPYAILSHTWDEKQEVTLQDMASPYLTDKTGYDKITATCKLALKHELEFAWIDTCCIDKTNNTELTESINSMFRWYQNAAICFVHLADLDHASSLRGRADADSLSNGEDLLLQQLGHCAWFCRGWTLQELLAPRRVDFYDAAWECIGSKHKLAPRLAEITSIPASAIVGDEPLSRYSTAQRMAWASSRVTTRVEDAAYSLIGLFDVNMPLIYGEGKRAFHRLQEEIIKRSTDLTLFAWLPTDNDNKSRMHAQSQKPASSYCPLLASSPADFQNCHQTLQFRHDDSEFTMTNRGLRITTYLVLVPTTPGLEERSNTSMSLDGSLTGGGANSSSTAAGNTSRRGAFDSNRRYRYVLSIGYIKSSMSEVGIWLKKIGPGLFLRETSQTLAQISKNRLRSTNTTENHTFNILLHPSTASAAATEAQASSATLMSPSAAPMVVADAKNSTSDKAAAAAATANSLRALYHPRLFPRGIHVPYFGDRGILFSSPPPNSWDERTRIFCQPESRNDVVAFSCTSRQGRHRDGTDDDLSFGVLIDYRQGRDSARCLVIDRYSLESRVLFVLAMRQQGEPVRWYVIENELPSISASSDLLRIKTNGGRTYEVLASIVVGDVEIDDCMTKMFTLDIKITNVTTSV